MPRLRTAQPSLLAPAPRLRPGSLRTAWLIGAVLLAAAAAAQISPEGRSRKQRLRQRSDTTAAGEQTRRPERQRPDTIRLATFNPFNPALATPVPDSQLSLAYTRYDPAAEAGPDVTRLGSLGLPAVVGPLAASPYARELALSPHQLPGYADPAPAFFTQNFPFSYAAYDQGGEIDDGQIRALFGRTFRDGWSLGLRYRNLYQGARNSRYPRAGASRTSLGVGLSRQPDSSRHRSYAWITLGSFGFDVSGGYAFALDDTRPIPENPDEAVPAFADLRTSGRRRHYQLLHRVFLREQIGPQARGWALAASVRHRRSDRLAVTTADEPAALGPFGVDERGLRVGASSSSLTAEALVEHFAGDTSALAFDVAAGVYGGRQRLRADYLGDARELLLAGLQGRLAGRVPGGFVLSAAADLALGSRAGEGLVRGSLAWRYREAFDLAAELLLERSSQAFAATVVGANDELLFAPDLPATTHTQLGARAALPRGGVRARGYLDVYVEPIRFAAPDGQPAVGPELALPTLELEAPLRYAWLRLDNRLVARRRDASRAPTVPAYAGQHALFADFSLFARRMRVLSGLDLTVRSPAQLPVYLPFSGAFASADLTQSVGWQYTLDAFVALRVRILKAFLRLDNLAVAADGAPLPTTAAGYPVVRAESVGGSRALLRFGVAFFLLD